MHDCHYGKHCAACSSKTVAMEKNIMDQAPRGSKKSMAISVMNM